MQIDKGKAGPSKEKRDKSPTYFYGKASTEKDAVELRLKTPNGYSLTAVSAILIATKILDDNFKPGYQTPAMAYGEDYILEIEGSTFIS